MLTAKENLLECIRGGNPDRFVNQYEFIKLRMNPSGLHSKRPQKGEADCQNAWGVTYSFPENVPAGFPVHSPEKVVIKDIENWKEYVHAPSLDFPEEEWAMFKEQYDAIDSTKALKAAFVAPGLFEQCHHLGEISATLMNLAMYPDEMHDLIKYLTEYELKLAELVCSHLKPDALFHHDDWGGERSTFMSPAMFEDFFVDAYKQIYGYYKDHGVELVFHHSDSYAATFVPAMIEMGIDVWQGPMRSNDVPSLIKKYGGKISFMGDIDNKYVDFEGWTKEDCRRAAIESMESCGMKYYIPCITQGGPGSVYKGSYQALADCIDEYNKEKFGVEVTDDFRLPLQIMF